MSNYRRDSTAGGTWFFTVNCADRHGHSLLIDHITQLRCAFRTVKREHPFRVDAIVILPEHLHCIWTLPSGDCDYSRRWALIKGRFSRAVPRREFRSQSRMRRGERGLWQRRFWEHRIRDEEDMARHVDYIHWNPVKHGWVDRVRDWPYSSFHGFVREGLLPLDWASEPEMTFPVGER